MSTTYKYRLYPTRAQETQLKRTLDICRWVYNTRLAAKREAWDTDRRSLSKYDLNYLLPALKVAHPEWTSVHSQVLQNIPDRITKAFAAFFRRVQAGETPGYPRFKGYGRYRSFTFPQYTKGISFESTGRREAYLRVSKIGLIFFKYHRPLVGTIKTVTINVKGLGEWWVCFAVENTQDVVDPPRDADVGIDVGLTTFATMSDGTTIPNPRFLRTSAADLARVQRKQALAYAQAEKRGQLTRNKDGRTRKYTGYLNKCGKATRKVHKRIANARKNFIHQATYTLVREFGALYVEALQIAGMLKNHSLAKSISDAAWRMFLDTLAYKAARAGRRYRAINPRKTSQWCSGCGAIVKKTLAMRTHHCPVCGLVMDRDLNAASNILALGRQCP